jgi:hypothetical protein
LFRVHSHVERAFSLDRESSLRFVDLKRRDSDIEKYCLDRARPKAFTGCDRSQITKTTLPQEHPVAEASQPLPAPLKRRRVLVDPEQSSVWIAGFQQHLGMAGAAERSVDHRCSGPGRQTFDDFL